MAGVAASIPRSPPRRLFEWLASGCGTATAFLVLASLPATAARAVTCTFNSAPSLAFGNYSTTNASPTDSVGTIAITCNSAPVGVAKLSTGTGTYAQRRMVSGAHNLNYNLYTSSARTTVWGDGTGGTGTVSFTNKNSTLSVYGRIPALQNAFPGAYSDTVVVTITF